jgi:tRNA pseudouridine55 synthase
MGRGARKPPGFRDIDGILLLDKPVGISSNKALQTARFLFKANKAGHTGSLDPLATGMLPICFGEATKFSAYLIDASKTYRAICQLGRTTTTADAEGEVTSESAVQVGVEDITTVLGQFVGCIDQIPPMHSAVKHKGQRLYRLARQGKEVERNARKIEIYSLQLVGFEGSQLEMDVHCSKGTYIRTLAEDIGKTLGCGAYLANLRRTGVEPFWHETSYSLDRLRELSEQGLDFLDRCLLPVNSALVDLPELIVEPAAANFLKQGRAVMVNEAPHSGLLSLVLENGQFIGIGQVSSDGKISPKRLMNTAR